MEAAILFLIIAIAIYPIWLIFDILLLTRKALKIYIKNNKYSFYNSDPGAM